MQISRQRKPFCITSMLSATCIMSLERQASQVPAATREIPVPSASKPPRGPEDGDTKGEHHPTSGSNVPFHPFQNGAEWELANFLALHLTKSQISEFFEINLVHVFKWKNRPKPSFDTVDNLFAMLQEHKRGRRFFFPVRICSLAQLEPKWPPAVQTQAQVIPQGQSDRLVPPIFTD